MNGFVAGLCELRSEGKIGQVSIGMNSDRIEPGGAHDGVLRLIKEAPAGTFNAALLAGGCESFLDFPSTKNWGVESGI